MQTGGCTNFYHVFPKWPKCTHKVQLLWLYLELHFLGKWARSQHPKTSTPRILEWVFPFLTVMKAHLQSQTQAREFTSSLTISHSYRVSSMRLLLLFTKQFLKGPSVYFLCVETAGFALEEIDIVFAGSKLFLDGVPSQSDPQL